MNENLSGWRALLPVVAIVLLVAGGSVAEGLASLAGAGGQARSTSGALGPHN